MNNVRFIMQVSKGLIRNRRARRTVMFYDMVIVMLLVFAGATFLNGWLREHPLFFIGYWAACAWLTFLAILLALYDMAMVRLEERRARRALEEQLLAGNEIKPGNDSDTP